MSLSRKKRRLEEGRKMTFDEYRTSGILMPRTVFKLTNPITLSAAETLNLYNRATLRFDHYGPGIIIDGVDDVTVVGGILDGGTILSSWYDNYDGTWSHSYTHERKLNEMFVDGVRRYRSRWPETWPNYMKPLNMSPTNFELPAWTTLKTSDIGTALNGMAITDIELHNHWEWKHFWTTCTSVEVDGISSTLNTCSSVNYTWGIENHNIFLVNLLPFVEGTFAHDRNNNRIIYKPFSYETLTNFSAVIPMCRQLVSINPSTPITPLYRTSNIRLQDVTLRYSFACSDDNGSKTTDNPRDYSAVVSKHGTDGVYLDHCLFEHLGGIGYKGIYWQKNTFINNCRFTDIGSNSIWLTEGWRNLSAFLTPVDDAFLTCEDTIFEYCGQIDNGAIGVLADGVSDTKVRRCKVRHHPYCGMILFYRPIGENIVEDCEFSDCMKLLRDGAAVYTAAEPRDSNSSITYRNNAFHDGRVNPWHTTAQLYFESGSKDILATENLFWNNLDHGTQNYSLGCVFTGNTYEVFPPTDSRFRYTPITPVYRNYSPSQMITWHDTNTLVSRRGIVTSSPSNISGNEWQITLNPAITWHNTSCPTIVGMWVMGYSADGTIGPYWYRITQEVWTSDNDPRYVTVISPNSPMMVEDGWKVCIFDVRSDGNTELDTATIAPLTAAWIATHPEPNTP